jgi:hypothetical protein
MPSKINIEMKTNKSKNGN